MDMMKRCNELRKVLENHLVKLRVNPSRFDMLGEYRKWWDKQNIDSETEDGWPKEFVFKTENINRFIRQEWMS